MACPINPIVEECKRLRKALHPISERYHGLTERVSAKNTMYPFVLLLGNHSSGKSSFINHILKRKVQMTGVAPTDDNFTIIGPGDSDIDRNGPALIGDPDLGFGGLKAFGPVLVNHTHLKVRSDIAIKDFMIVDSPGMIDSPVTEKTPAASGPVGMDRGYNFEGVVRWYAERSDVILLFFDPDKPGTTGETLSILTTALVGLDHKLYIILNKADQFHKIHDFARAYGSLCWNLSKVIPRKDLPRIHTMCLPMRTDGGSRESSRGSSPFPSPASSAFPSPMVSKENDVVLSPSAGGNSPTQVSVEAAAAAEKLQQAARVALGGLGSGFERMTNAEIVQQHEANGGDGNAHPKSFFEQGIHDLEESRAEIELETFNAPRRRVDNEISRLTENVSGLLMHCRIVDRVLEIYNNRLWRARALTAAVLVGSVGVTVGVSYLCDWLLPATPSPAAAAVTATAADAASVPAVDAVVEAPAVGKGKVPSSSSSTSRGSPGTAVAAGVRGNTKAASLPPPTPVAVESATPPASVALPRQAGAFDALWDWRAKRTVVGWTALTGLLANVGVITYEHFSISALLETFNHRATFESIYTQLYQKEIAANNESTLALGKLVLDAMPTSVNGELVQRLQRVDKVEFTALNRILNEDIPNLRRRASPDFPMLSPPVKLTQRHSYDELASLAGSNTHPMLNLSPNTLERVPYKSHRAVEHPGMHVHFSPSTNSSPVTTKERKIKATQKKRPMFSQISAPTGCVTPGDVQAYLSAHPAGGSEEQEEQEEQSIYSFSPTSTGSSEDGCLLVLDAADTVGQEAPALQLPVPTGREEREGAEGALDGPLLLGKELCEGDAPVSPASSDACNGDGCVEGEEAGGTAIAVE